MENFAFPAQLHLPHTGPVQRPHYCWLCTTPCPLKGEDHKMLANTQHWLIITYKCVMVIIVLHYTALSSIWSPVSVYLMSVSWLLSCQMLNFLHRLVLILSFCHLGAEKVVYSRSLELICWKQPPAGVKSGTDDSSGTELHNKCALKPKQWGKRVKCRKVIIYLSFDWSLMCTCPNAHLESVKL